MDNKELLSCQNKCKMTVWIKKHHKIDVFLVIIFLLNLPVLINYCYEWETDCKVLQLPTPWAIFWATYLAAIASFTMVFVTWLTLKQNKNQLDELKRQWEEQNKPILSCSLAKSSSEILIELHNSSQVSAHNVKVKLTNKTDKDILRFNETFKLLDDITFVIPPFSKKQIPIYITPYIDGNYSGYILVNLSYSGRCENFELYLAEINLTTTQFSNKEICDRIEKVGSEIKQKKIL